MTVVVPTRDRPELLAGCLEALCRELVPGDELIVVDSEFATIDFNPRIYGSMALAVPIRE